MSFNIILSSMLFVLIFFFYLLTVGSYFHPLVYPLIDRITYSTQFIDKYYIGKFYDSLIISFGTILWFLLSIRGKVKFIAAALYGILTFIALLGNIKILFDILCLISIPILVSFIVVNKILKENRILFFSKQMHINYFVILGITIGSISFYVVVDHVLNPELTLPSLNYMYYIYLLLSILTPFFLVFIALCFPIKWLTNRFIKKDRNDNKDNKKNQFYQYKSIKFRTRIYYLGIIIIISTIITVIPHIYTINKNNQVVGSDSKDYVRFLNSMNNSSTIQEFLNQAFVKQVSGDRPISLIVFFLWSHIVGSGSIITAIEYLPLLLGPILILCIYFLTVELTANHVTAILASFLTITSFQILVGTYAGLYSNWFSLIFAYLAFLFFFRSLSNPNKSNIILFSFLMAITLLSHAPTWSVLTLVIIILLGILLKLNFYLKKNILYLFLSIIPSIVIDSIRTIFIKTSGVMEDISFAQSQGARLFNPNDIWNNLVNSTHIFMAGQFGNPIIFLLVLYWFYHCDIKDKSTIWLFVFFSLIFLSVIVGEQEIQTRVLYEIPFQIPAAIALTNIKRNSGNPIVFTICFWLLIISIRTASNFYLIQH
jgi:hypothetical protein